MSTALVIVRTARTACSELQVLERHETSFGLRIDYRPFASVELIHRIGTIPRRLGLYASKLHSLFSTARIKHQEKRS